MTSDPADVRVDLLRTMEEMQAAAELLRQVWGGPQYPVQAALLLALEHVGGYVSGAWRGDRLVGASMGLTGPTDPTVLHSHITGVVADAAGRGIGTALKQHQADWCLAHDITTAMWTFDPLVARNAWFNLARLGVRVQAYLVDFYGDMPDDRNRGQGSDRLLVAWDLTSVTRRTAANPSARIVDEVAVRVVDVGANGEPVVADAPLADTVAVAVPPDIEALRTADPALAIRWRHAVRDALSSRLPPTGDDWAMTGFTRDGSYRLTRRRPTAG